MWGNSIRSGKGLRICVVTVLLWQLKKINYLCFIRTVIHFSYLMSMENLDKEMCICLKYCLEKSGIFFVCRESCNSVVSSSSWTFMPLKHLFLYQIFCYRKITFPDSEGFDLWSRNEMVLNFWRLQTTLDKLTCIIIIIIIIVIVIIIILILAQIITEKHAI